MVAVTLGGRAADLVVGNGANTGAEADLARATKLLLDAHESQGLRGDLVYRPVLGSSGHEHTAESIAAELNRQLNRASAIFAADRVVVLALAERLVAEKVLAGNEVAAAVGAAEQRPAAEDTSPLAAGAAHNPGSGGAQSGTAPRQAGDGAEGDLATAIHPLINAMSRHDPTSSRDGAGRCALPQPNKGEAMLGRGSPGPFRFPQRTQHPDRR